MARGRSGGAPGPLRRDGQPDMRYAANRDWANRTSTSVPYASGSGSYTPSSSSSSSSRFPGPLRSDGMPDMRYAANRAHADTTGSYVPLTTGGTYVPGRQSTHAREAEAHFRNLQISSAAPGRLDNRGYADPGDESNVQFIMNHFVSPAAPAPQPVHVHVHHAPPPSAPVSAPAPVAAPVAAPASASVYTGVQTRSQTATRPASAVASTASQSQSSAFEEAVQSRITESNRPGRLRDLPISELDRLTNNRDGSNLLASGGFGDVYVTTFDNRKVAIKILRDPGTTLKDQKAVVRLREEVGRQAASVHPHVVPVLATIGFSHLEVLLEKKMNVSDSQIDIMTAFANGASLYDRLYRRPVPTKFQEARKKNVVLGDQPLTWRQRLATACHVAAALKFLHAQRIVHRGIKSLNIFLSFENGEFSKAYVGDFGVVRAISQEQDLFVPVFQRVVCTLQGSQNVGSLHPVCVGY